MDSKDRNNIIALILGVFSVFIGLAQILSIPLFYKIPMLLLTVIFGVGAAWFFYRSNLYQIPSNKHFPIQSENSAKYIENEAELIRFWELDNSAYGATSLPFELSRKWWLD